MSVLNCLFILPFYLSATVIGDSVLHRCLDTISHKTQPGPEDVLFKQCTPWKNFSCCTHEITQKAHESNLYNFNFNHCPHKKNMSEECKKHFIQDLCFYECSPNIGPWIVKVNMKIRKERFFGVPLCKSDCDAWFSACADDYTCTDNWARNFIWNNSGNNCVKDAECSTFRDIFLTAKQFCEKVWDYSWEVVSDRMPCMRMWFDPAEGNPNEAVTKLKLEEMKRQEDNSNAVAVLSVGTTLMCYSLILLYNLGN